MNEGIGWGSVFLGLVLIFFGSKSFLQHSLQAKKQKNYKDDN
jgi:hypothetical protein